MRLIGPLLAVLALAAAPPNGVAKPHPAPAQNFPNIGYATWTDDEPRYRLYPGDEVDISVPSAPELNKSVTVQPDGRITLPLIPAQMAANRTPDDLAAQLSAAYASQLLRPEVGVSVRAQPLKVFIGGEVDKPGVYDMPGDIDALRAIIQAGGAKPTGKMSQVVIIRRGRNGAAMLRTVDLNRPFKDPSHSDLVPLRRFDIIYVPRTGLAEVGKFMGQMRDALPISFNYAIGGPVF